MAGGFRSDLQLPQWELMEAKGFLMFSLISRWHFIGFIYKCLLLYVNVFRRSSHLMEKTLILFFSLFVFWCGWLKKLKPLKRLHASLFAHRVVGHHLALNSVKHSGNKKKQSCFLPSVFILLIDPLEFLRNSAVENHSSLLVTAWTPSVASFSGNFKCFFVTTTAPSPTYAHVLVSARSAPISFGGRGNGWVVLQFH